MPAGPMRDRRPAEVLGTAADQGEVRTAAPQVGVGMLAARVAAEHHDGVMGVGHLGCRIQSGLASQRRTAAWIGLSISVAVVPRRAVMTSTRPTCQYASARSHQSQSLRAN